METHTNTNMNANTWLAPCDDYYYPTQTHSHSLGATSGSSYSSGYTQQEYDYYFNQDSNSYGQTSFGLSHLTQSPAETSLDEEYADAEVDAEVEQDGDGDADAYQETDSTGGKRTRQSSDDDEADKPKKRRRSQKDSGEGSERKRSSRACQGCRTAKMKCMPGPSMAPPDESHPCMRCALDNRPCEFKASRRGKPPVKKLAQLNWQLDHMDEILHSLRQALDDKRRNEGRRSHSYPY